MYAAVFKVPILAAIFCLATCEDLCGPPRVVHKASVSDPSKSVYGSGSSVIYKCDRGYISGGRRVISRCVKNPETNEMIWTEPEHACHPRSCGYPGDVENAHHIGALYTFSSSVDYVCNEGYILSGTSRRYCEASGTWSGIPPSCTVINCTRPTDPENGRVSYFSLEFNSELRYQCNEGFRLTSTEPRICGADGRWTGADPTCGEIECALPRNLDFGKVEFYGNKVKVGSVVFFSCDAGRSLVGSGSSTCLKTGDWASPIPKCVVPCTVPYVRNGELGRYVDQYHRNYRQWIKVFNKVSQGTTLNENEEVVLRCKEDYVSEEQLQREITIKCNDGVLSPEPKCMITSCSPLPIPNGRPIVRSVQHGQKIQYQCNPGFEHKSYDLTCTYGSLTGSGPVCEDTRCNKESLNYPGLARDKGFVLNTGSFEPRCEHGYEVTKNGDTRVYCDKGEWKGNLPPCAPASCRPPSISNARPFVQSVQHGQKILYQCNPGFEHKKSYNFTCMYGSRTGIEPVCGNKNLARCNKESLDYPGLVRLNGFVLNEGSFEPRCERGYEVTENDDTKIYCDKGQWKGNLPPCTQARCKRESLSNLGVLTLSGEGKSSLDEGEYLQPTCQEGFEFSNKADSKIYCREGNWTGNLPPCIPASCVDEPPVPANGRIISKPSSHAAVVQYECYPYYWMDGNSNVKCWYGRWSGSPPTCKDIMNCTKPEDPENGQALYSSLEYDSELNYTCNEGFHLFSAAPRKCGPDGRWTGVEPVCKEPCSLPFVDNGQLGRYQKNGASSVFEKVSNGIILHQNQEVILKCNEGYFPGGELRGEITIKCDNGTLSPQPECIIRPCELPVVENGKLGKYEKPHHYTTRTVRTLFKEIRRGTTLNENEEVTVKCDEGYMYSTGQPLEEINIVCLNGTLSPEPQCVSTSCVGDPPRILNGRAVVESKQHGKVIFYRCETGFKKAKGGNITCVYGSWTGNTPVCEGTRCDKKSLDYPGLIMEKGFVLHGKSFEPRCNDSYEVTEISDRNIYCNKGEWTGNLPPCTPARCRKDPPEPENGKMKSVPLSDHGAVIEYECFQDYIMAEENNVTCSYGNWIGSPSTCKETEEQPEVELGKPNTEAVTMIPTGPPELQVHLVENNTLKKPDGDDSADHGRESTDNEEESQTTVPTVNILCSCRYDVQDQNLIAYDGEKLLKANDQIYAESTVRFHCKQPGFFHLNGRKSVTCPRDCLWYQSFPVCDSPSGDRPAIEVLTVPLNNFEIDLRGIITVMPGITLWLRCSISYTYHTTLKWRSTSTRVSGMQQQPFHEVGSLFLDLTISSASHHYDGTYTCYDQYGSSRSIIIAVKDTQCPEISGTRNMDIYYTRNRRSGGIATFHCISPYERDGPLYLTCETSGLWSGQPPVCYWPSCSIGSVYDVIPEGVVPLVNDSIPESVPYGYELQLGCDDVGAAAMILKDGSRTAKCSNDRKWTVEAPVQCIQGCRRLHKKDDSELLISPEKVFYNLGDSVTFSCPEGKSLTGDVERVMCFKDGWTPKIIPDCR